MQSPLLIDPYIHGTLLRDLTGHDRSPASFVLYLWIALEQQRHGGPIEASYAQLAEETGLSRSTAQSSVAWLLGRKLLSVQRANVTATPVYTALTPWVRPRRTAAN